MRQVLRAGLLLMGPKLTPVPEASIVIEGGRIAEIRTARTAASRTDIDFSSKVVMAGLIDTHVHLQLTPANDHVTGRQSYEADRLSGLLPLRTLRNAHAALGAGITTVRDCGSDMTILAVRDAITSGDPGPRILAAGQPITTTAGHLHWLGLQADSLDEVRKATRQLVAQGVDVVKVVASGGNMTAGSNPREPQYSAEEIAAAANEAHRLGRRVVAHALNVEAIRRCIEGRVDSIDHCSWQLADSSLCYDQAIGETLVQSGARVGITGSGILRRLLHQGEAGLIELRHTLDAHRQLFLAGASVTVHSDAGVRFTPIERFDLSVKVMMHGLGVTSRDALLAVTSVAAEAIGLEDEIGTIGVGKRADLLVLGANPLDDLDNLRLVEAVFRDGVKLVERGWLKIPTSRGVHTPQGETN